jgi:hypothetical protein
MGFNSGLKGLSKQVSKSVLCENFGVCRAVRIHKTAVEQAVAGSSLSIFQLEG